MAPCVVCNVMLPPSAKRFFRGVFSPNRNNENSWKNVDIRRAAQSTAVALYSKQYTMTPTTSRRSVDGCPECLVVSFVAASLLMFLLAL